MIWFNVYAVCFLFPPGTFQCPFYLPQFYFSEKDTRAAKVWLYGFVMNGK